MGGEDGSFGQQFDLNVSTKLVKCYNLSVALYGAEAWTFRKVDKKYLESFEMWCLEAEEQSLRFQTTGWPHTECIIPQTVSHGLTLLRMGKIIARNMSR
jgi:hypothetical protein